MQNFGKTYNNIGINVCIHRTFCKSVHLVIFSDKFVQLKETLHNTSNAANDSLRLPFTSENKCISLLYLCIFYKIPTFMQCVCDS